MLRLYDDTQPVGAEFDALLDGAGVRSAAMANRVIILTSPRAEVA